MFYQPGVTPHSLPRDPYKACVVPRPIGWISTRNVDGSANIAPFSQWNNIGFNPHYVMFSATQKPGDEGRKDTVVNAEREGEFCWSLATYELRDAVNLTSEQLPYGQDEFVHAGLTKQPGEVVKPPMVKESPIKVVIGRVIGIHIDDGVLKDGLIDITKTQPIARCGYYQYAVIKETFEMFPPGDPRMKAALVGSAKAGEAEAEVEEKRLQNEVGGRA
ncbi:hypothetical protein JCM10207_003223 [Rhodosporidiobolus poonsookiae]